MSTLDMKKVTERSSKDNTRLYKMIVEPELSTTLLTSTKSSTLMSNTKAKSATQKRNLTMVQLHTMPPNQHHITPQSLIQLQLHTMLLSHTLPQPLLLTTLQPQLLIMPQHLITLNK